VWIDCEMTGLDLARDALIEVAAIVTDAELNPLDDGVEVVIHAADDLLDTMVPVVRDMHAASGLTDAVRASTRAAAVEASAAAARARTATRSAVRVQRLVMC